MSALHGTVAVVTDGTSGIGLADAQQRLVKEGARVSVTGRRRSELHKANALIGDSGTTVWGDATSTAALDSIFCTILAEMGKLDVLVANSGRIEPKTFGKVTEESSVKTFALNARAALFTPQNARRRVDHPGRPHRCPWAPPR